MPGKHLQFPLTVGPLTAVPTDSCLILQLSDLTVVWSYSCPHWQLSDLTVVWSYSCRIWQLISDSCLLTQLGPPVSDVTFFGPKEDSLGPLLMPLHFWTKGGLLGPPISDVTFFWPKQVSWGPPNRASLQSDTLRSNPRPCRPKAGFGLVEQNLVLAASRFSFWYWNLGGTVKKHPASTKV